MKDIFEKVVVLLWGIGLLMVIIIGCKRCSRSTDNVSSDNVLITDTICEISSCHSSQDSQPAPIVQARQQQSQRHLVAYNGRYFSYSAKFADRNDKHLAAAGQIGLSRGPQNRAAAAKMQDQLCEITSNRWYVVEELTHSLPYLVPTAAHRLDSIGAEFADILSRNNLPAYRFRVTSVLRSEEDIRRLQRCNHNSISNSPHNYGATFDIGYAHFDQEVQTVDSMTEDNLKLVLAQVLLNQQRAGHIYVKYEYKQGCFHITARN